MHPEEPLHEAFHETVTVLQGVSSTMGAPEEPRSRHRPRWAGHGLQQVPLVALQKRPPADGHRPADAMGRVRAPGYEIAPNGIPKSREQVLQERLGILLEALDLLRGLIPDGGGLGRETVGDPMPTPKVSESRRPRSAASPPWGWGRRWKRSALGEATLALDGLWRA